uniref:uridine kinase family protein n=1 Tax=Agathobacter sp. TaxID=2021311 RepID=UPI004057BA64
MQNFKKILLEQSKLHPSIMPQDIVKLCYQAAFGAEHLLLNRKHAFDYFFEEYNTICPTPGSVFEPICLSYARCSLASWKHLGLPAKWLFEMFYHTASEKSQETDELFWKYIALAESMLTEGVFSFHKEEWDDYIANYEAHAVTAVHHSERYRQNEHPAYRLVHTRYTQLLPILKKLARLPDTDNPHIIAIDGRAAAGKSTVAKLLSHILDAPIIQMDDFFLPPSLRTEARFSESGGNVHYERFCEEVLPFLKQNTTFSYQHFDCGMMDYNGKKEIPSSAWYIIEGSYSMHPAFGKYMDFSVFCDVSSEEQISRIRLRNGDEMLKRFIHTWIPMEEHYFDSEEIQKHCDIIYTKI